MWKNGKEGNTEGETQRETNHGRKRRSQGKRGDAASLQGAPRGHLAEV